MIVVPFPFGRMCNRLVLAASFIAFAEEFGETFVHLSFADYCRFFEKTRFSPFLIYKPSTPSKTHKAGVSIVNIFSSHDRIGQCFMLNDPCSGFPQLAASKRVTFALGWSFRAHVLTEKHQALIRHYFMPCDHYRAHAEANLAQIRKSTDQVVGIHIRQTDYRSFAGGKFFFAHETYRRIMEEIAGQLPGKTGFLICSDASIPAYRFIGLHVALGTGHPIEDNYALSLCDYIVGPRSTYSHWASYFGRVPLFFIEDSNVHPKLKDFSVRLSV